MAGCEGGARSAVGDGADSCVAVVVARAGTGAGGGRGVGAVGGGEGENGRFGTHPVGRSSSTHHPANRTNGANWRAVVRVADSATAGGRAVRDRGVDGKTTSHLRTAVVDRGLPTTLLRYGLGGEVREEVAGERRVRVSCLATVAEGRRRMRLLVLLRRRWRPSRPQRHDPRRHQDVVVLLDRGHHPEPVRSLPRLPPSCCARSRNGRVDPGSSRYADTP